MLRRSILVLVLILVTVLPTTLHAQNTHLVETQTGRLSLELPEGWVSRFVPEEEELRGVDSETLVIGSSDQAIDGYLNFTGFTGTVMFLSAYPYNVYTPSVLGFPTSMLNEITVYPPEQINAVSFAGYDGAEYLYLDNNDDIFIWEILLDLGEMTYRGTAYSNVLDDYTVAQQIINSLHFAPIERDSLLATDQATRTVINDDGRIGFEIPESWLYWVEGDNTFSFASSGKGYAAISYAFQPELNEEVAVIVQRFIKSALRDGELEADRTANLPAIAQRLAGENGGLLKDKALQISAWNGITRLDTAWLVPGATGTAFTRTVLLDAQDVVYFIQAQYAADNVAQIDPIVNQIFDSMTYTAPTALIEVSQIGLQPGQTAPDFTLPTLEGEDATLSDYRGKVILMNMWASWCGPCHEEAPFLQQLYDDYEGAFEVLAVNVGESAYEANGFALRYRLSFPVLLDDNEVVARQYNLTAYPTTYVIASDGVVLDMIRGSFSEQGLRDLLSIYVGR